MTLRAASVLYCVCELHHAHEKLCSSKDAFMCIAEQRPNTGANGMINESLVLSRSIGYTAWCLNVVCLTLVAMGPAEAEPLDITRASIADIQNAYRTGVLTAERLIHAYLARIDAYENQGPAINAIITLNPKAIEEARVLDVELASGRKRGPLHGIPIVLKDNFNTIDLPTTAGSQLLAGSMPSSDAYLVSRLREAGAIILAKVNLAEFAGSGGSVAGANDPRILKAGYVPEGYSSMGLQTLNPHDIERGPQGSSGGTGASVAAAFAQFGLGTDTGGSIRAPSSANGIVGLRPTYGLLSHSGIVPLALSLDMPGPMARNVYDVAASMNVMVGVDPDDASTETGIGKLPRDYTEYLRTGALKGARIGVARDFMGKHPETDRVTEDAIQTMRNLGAVIIDPVNFPEYLLAIGGPVYYLMAASEFKAQINDYLRTLGPGLPRSFDELVARANDPKTLYRSPGKAYSFKYTSSVALDLDDPVYLSMKNQVLPAIRASLLAIFERHNLDAIVYPTLARPASLFPEAYENPEITRDGCICLAAEAGFPDLIVPAGMTQNDLPVTISFLGLPWSEAQLLGYGYDFEQATHAIRLPKFTPHLESDNVTDGQLTSTSLSSLR
jgi:amidase